MANIKAIDASKFPVLFGEKNRPAEIVTDKSSLNLEGQVLETYSPKAGATYRFPKFEDSVIKRQPVVEGGKSYQFLMLCEESTDGGKSFHTTVINLNSLGKRDASNNPVHPTWYALGSIGKRAEKLCEMGEISVGTQGRVIKAPRFDNGKPLMEMARNADGSPQLKPSGEPVQIIATREQTVYDITPVAA